MAVRIKTIPNDILGAKKPEHHGAHKQDKASDASGQVNKILELEWEALGRKLNKHTGSGAELDKLRMQLKELQRQLREKDEMLKQANYKIATLQKQQCSPHEKQVAYKPQHENRDRFKAPARVKK